MNEKQTINFFKNNCPHIDHFGNVHTRLTFFILMDAYIYETKLSAEKFVHRFFVFTEILRIQDSLIDVFFGELFRFILLINSVIH